ncbi:hypothetical protein PY254_04295 [Rhodanobacter sp. AS-Z3]|uniref:efflux RND transporter periplasmic adaptor subunit n=1 Tax=Rhodanobacter sp. AS-Z3 TaxID=3031330 RepID=UPI0024785977|nr:hypothetical protein [Rhodanobacter sp. AS-Z3]WEN15899.1 hypothetical protein PY254_04295 [Rhodanobacter sp. AS-Z3]
MMRRGGWLLLILLAGCTQPATDRTVLEQARSGPLEFSVQGEGELHSTKPTPLLVPGRQWSSRQLNWMLADGSAVKKGELVARFSADQSKQDLLEAQIDLQRNALARVGKQAELADKNGQLAVDLIQVRAQHAIAARYANASLDAMARNDILDAVQDVHYLDVRQHILQWREDQSASRGVAELAVLDAQRNSFDTLATQKQADLDALELRAPHAGVLVLERDWTDQVPHVGGSLYAGNTFASLPDLDALEVELSVPQIEAQGIRVGDVVELHRWGLPAQTVKSAISWIGSAAQPRSRQNPVKYLALKTTVPAEVARRYGWMPGQRFVGKIILLQAAQGYSVPNMALLHDGGHDSVQVIAGDDLQTRSLKLGVRGATRTQVLDGLHSGDRILLPPGKAGETK